MQKKNTRAAVIIGIIAGIVIALLVIFLYLNFFDRSGHDSAEADVQMEDADLDEESGSLEEAFNGQTINYTDTMYFYRPTVDAISYDEERHQIYFNNIVLAYLSRDLSMQERENIAQSVGGTLMGNCSGALNLMQIQVPSTDRDGIDGYIVRLMAQDDVIYATYDMPVEVSANNSVTEDCNGWGGETDLGNTSKPGGNDWWAEAIDAYRAWDYAEGFSRVPVGVIDVGFYDQHEDFEGNMEVLNDYDYVLHGTHVSGLIAAVNNDVGIRGVSDGSRLLCMDFSPNHNNNLSSAEIISMMPQLVQNGAVVINMSAGEYFYNEEGWKKKKKEGPEKYDDKDYDTYVATAIELYKQTGIQVIAAMTSMHYAGFDDYLMIQAAGNGYNNGGTGVNSAYSCYYCGVNAVTYTDYVDSLHALEELAKMLPTDIDVFYLSEKLNKEATRVESLGLSYFTDRIIIVGAVENRRDNKGNYYMTYYSNYNVDICAPGGKSKESGIYSTIVVGEQYKNGGMTLEAEERLGAVYTSSYGNDAGTSMAAPIVAGTAALLWAKDPFMTPGEIKSCMLEQTNYVAIDEDADDNIMAKKNYPMLNAGMAAAYIYGDAGISTREISGYFSHDTDLPHDWNLSESGGFPNLSFPEAWEDNGFWYCYSENRVLAEEEGSGYLFANGGDKDVTFYGVRLGEEGSKLDGLLAENGWRNSQYPETYDLVIGPAGIALSVTKNTWYRGNGQNEIEEIACVVTDDSDGTILYWWITNEKMATMDNAVDRIILGYPY